MRRRRCHLFLEKAIFRFLGNPELVGYTGKKDAKSNWEEKNISYAYNVDNKDYKAMPKKFAGEMFTVLITVRDGNIVSMGLNEGVSQGEPWKSGQVQKVRRHLSFHAPYG